MLIKSAFKVKVECQCGQKYYWDRNTTDRIAQKEGKNYSLIYISLVHCTTPVYFVFKMTCDFWLISINHSINYNR